MVKILGGSLVLIAAYLFGMKLMEPAAEHIRLLEEGDLLYRILESEIRKNAAAYFIWRVKRPY